MKNIRNTVLWLLMCGLCLGACKQAPKEKETAEPTTVRETQDKENAQEEQPIEPETPYVLSLVTIPESDYVWEGGKMLCRTGYTGLCLDETKNSSKSGALAFPQLAATLEKMNDQAKTTAAESLKYLEIQARQMASGDYFDILSWEEDLWVTRADSQILSILKMEYSYTGGAHGNYVYTGVTLESESGREMKLEEVVTDPNHLAELASKRLVEKYPDIQFFEAPEETLVKEMEEGYLTWVLGYDGITLYFSPYELAPYAYGTQSVTILYSEEPELFADQISQTPKSWAVRVVSGMDYDLKGDKTSDSVNVSAASIETGGEAYDRLTVSVNGQESVQRDLWFYNYTSYLVHSGSLNIDLLMVETKSDNDYRVMMIFDLNPENQGFQTPWQLSATGFYDYYKENEDGTYEYGNEIFSDPEHFHLTTKMDLLSTYHGIRWYGLSEEAKADGYLKPEQPWYDVDMGDHPLTLLVPLEMEVGDQGEKQAFPEGTKLWIVRTDGEYVEFLTEDNRCCRVYIQSAQWPGWIVGVEDKDITEIFDGMMFAG